MRKTVLTFGLIAGAILSVMMFAIMAFVDRINFDTAEVVGYTTMVLAFLMVFFGVKAYRDNVGGGEISFGRAFKVGILITAVATVCYVASWQVIYRTMTPDFGERYAAHQVEKLREHGATADEIAAEEQKMARFAEMYKNPLVNVAFTFLEPLPVGLVLTLVAAGVLSRRGKRGGVMDMTPGR